MSDSPHFVGDERAQAMLSLSQLGAHDRQAEREIRGYIETLEMRLNVIHTLLSEDNYYSEKSNAAWKLLGETLGKVSSTDPMFKGEV